MSAVASFRALVPGSDEPNGERWNRRARLVACVLVFFVALGVRLLYFTRAEAELYGFEQERFRVAHFYHEAAASLVEGDDRMVFPRDMTAENTLPAGYPPGYFVFMAALYRIFGCDMAIVLLAQCVLDALAAVLLVLLGEALFSTGTGLVAGLLMALSPQFASLSLVVKPDTLTVLPVLGALLLVVRGVRLRQVSAFVLAGLVLGVACWLRQNALLLAPLLAVVALVVGDWRRLWRGALAMIVVCVAVVSPVTVRNYLAYGSVVPVAFGSGFGLLSGLARDDYAGRYGLQRFAYNVTIEEAQARGLEPDDYILRYEELQAGEARQFEVKHSVLSVFAIDGIERDRERTRRALELIRSDPAYYASICWVRVKRLLGFTEQLRAVPLEVGPRDHAFETPELFRALGDPEAYYAVEGRLYDRVRPWLASAQRLFLSSLVLPPAAIGFLLIALAGWRRLFVLAALPVYYLGLQSLMWAEFRHTLPVHVSIFIAIGALVSVLWRVADSWRKRRPSGLRRMSNEGTPEREATTKTQGR